MDLSEANEALVGSKGAITLGGVTYLADGITPNHMGTLHRWLRRRLPSVMSSIAEDLKGLPKSIQEIIIREAVALRASGGQAMSEHFIQDQLMLPEPLAFFIWVLCRGNHPELKYETLIPIVVADGAEKILADLYEACGLGDLEKNRVGQNGSSHGEFGTILPISEKR